MEISDKHEVLTVSSTLSKNALYAPLSSYFTTEPSNSKQVASNLREKNLCTFLESVSSGYHSSVSPLGIQNGASNGRQGLKAHQIYQKLEQRALTLIKGGIGKSIVKATDEVVRAEDNRVGKGVRVAAGNNNNRNKRLVGSISNKKRKRLSRGSCNTKISSSKSQYMQGTTLFGLHQLWNKYMNSLLQQQKQVKSCWNASDVTMLVAQAELIGGKATIKKSKSTSHSGKAGIIVDCTKNTWKIAVPAKGTIATDDEDIFRRCHKWKAVIVPKNDSIIVINVQNESDGKIFQVEISGENVF